MVQCPRCNTETGTTGHCQACGTVVEQHARGGQQHGQDRTARAQTQSRAVQRSGSGGSLPTGLKLVCVLLGVFGTGVAYSGMVLGRASQTAARYGMVGGGSGLGGLAIVFVALGFGQFLAIYGLWTRRSWGWTAGIVVLGGGALSSLLVLIEGATANGMVGLLLYGGLGWYVYTKRWVYTRQTTPPHQRGPQYPQHSHQSGNGQQSRR